MQSSAAVAFRAVVMLGCLIAVPLAALFGTTLPDLFRKLLADRAGLIDFEYATPPAGTEGPRFSSTAQAAPSGVTQGSLTGSWGTEALPFDARQPRSSPGKQFSRQTAPPASLFPSNVSPDHLAPGGRPRVRPGGEFDSVLASYEAGTSAGEGLEALRWPESPDSDLPKHTDRFSHIQQRLRELGATYSLLETWGDRGQLYRFYCRMAMAGSSQFTRYFEATDAEPLSAMAQVLEQVEAWRSAGRP